MNDELATSESPSENSQNPSELENDDLYVAMRQWFNSDSQHSQDWRDEARKMFDFRAGDQWEEKTKRQMEDKEGRATITFNRVLPIVKAVAGIEINTRQETIFLPRGNEEGEVIANEELSAASEWMGQQCDAQQQESQAFQDMLTCGMGWTENRMDYELDPDGKYIEQAISPLEMYWDASARAQNIMDSRRRWRARKMTLADARAMFPDVDDADLNCTWASGIESSKVQAIEDRRLKQESNRDTDPKQEIVILQIQWWEREKYHRVANPLNGELEEHDDESLAALKKQVKQAAAVPGPDGAIPQMTVESVQQTRRVYKQAFIGGKVLKKGECPRPDGFTLNCMTGEQHVGKGVWFGLVKQLKDPQMMANKWLTQATHVINTSAKGGILAEEDAFVDVREAQLNYARPDAITFVKKGAINGGKIMQKPGTGMANPYVQLLGMAIDSMPQVTGINMELLGMRDVNQPGVLEAHRKQAAMTILATLFDSLTAFRIEVGRTRLYFIQNHIADGRLIRIAHKQGGFQAIKLMKDKTVGAYDVVVSEAPSSPNQKEQTWAALQSILPAFQQMMTPEVAVMLLDYVPGIPQQLIDGLKGLLQSQQQNPDNQVQKQLAYGKQQSEINKNNAAADRDSAQAKNLLSQAVVKVAASTGENALNHARADRERALATHSKVQTLTGLTPSEEPPLFPTGGGGQQLPQLPQIPQQAGPVFPSDAAPGSAPGPSINGPGQ